MTMSIIAFIIGLWCLLAVVGYILRFALGRGDEENFVPNFINKSMGIIWKIIVTVIAGAFVYIVVSLIQTL
jgi:hypothetical protein